MNKTIFVAALLAATAAAADDKATIAALDTQYQAAVKANNADTMANILAPDFVLVVGSGKVYTTADLLQGARDKSTIYEHQEEDAGTQTVRVWGDTAVVTAKLWLVGQTGGKPFDRKLWFSDTYHRTKDGWRYVFGQASLALPEEK
ncbi:MAG: nuclear transport factor 2 family protein [Alphaproteobacteria bacterium]|nr:nuclear transport factor 2 family protein [Alphaproteobacteria bacterium]